MFLALIFAVRSEAQAGRLLVPVAGMTFAGDGVSVAGVARVRALALDRTALADLRSRQTALVPALPLGRDRLADVVLHRIEPFGPGTRVEVTGAKGSRLIALPDQAYFTGNVVGEPDSRVLLIAGRDQVQGFVATRDGIYPFGRPYASGVHLTYALDDVDPSVYPPPADFCANDLHPEVNEAAGRFAKTLATQAVLPPAASSMSGLVQADIAIETDGELRAKFASDEAARDYLTSLAAAATAVYERDVLVRLNFSYIRLWQSASADPWTGTDLLDALLQLRSYWNDPSNGMGDIAGSPDLVHLVSGRPVQGGIGYLDVLCNQSSGYAVSEVFGGFNLAVPSSLWDVLVFIHELGHNFGSRHTHCYDPPVDKCYNAESGCYSGPTVSSRGTIMSYCHLSGGVSNTDLLFGNVVSNRIGTSVAAATCLEAVVGPPTTTSTTTSTSSTDATATSTTSSSTTTTMPPDGNADTDGDGVPDPFDACEQSPPGDLVDQTGCSVCPCSGARDGTPWLSHRRYVMCVGTEVKQRQRDGTLTRTDGGAVLRSARRSTCGRPHLTRCCVYAGPDDEIGTCSIKWPARCETANTPPRLAGNVGGGSCLPNPCEP